jgi:hypothetical protein
VGSHTRNQKAAVRIAATGHGCTHLQARTTLGSARSPGKFHLRIEQREHQIPSENITACFGCYSLASTTD